MSDTPPSMTSTPPPHGATAPTGSRAEGRETERATQARRRQTSEQLRVGQRQGRSLQQRRSTAGPLLLLLGGIVLLRLQTGHLSWWTLIAGLRSWWPAVLLSVGLLMCGEWFLEKLQGGPGSIPRRVVLGGPTRLSLILLAVAGIGSTLVHNRPLVWDNLSVPEHLQDWGGLSRLFGDTLTMNGSAEAPLAPAGELVLSVPHGRLSVVGSSEDGQVHVEMHGRVFTWQNDEFYKRQQQAMPHFSGTRDHLVLTTAADSSDHATFQVTLPHGASVVVHGGEGDVSLEELRGTTTVSDVRGAVRLTALSGNVRLKLSDEDATVTAHSLGHGLTLEGQAGNLDLSDISGPLDLQGNFFGTTQLQRIQGKVLFQSTYTHVDCAAVPGSLLITGRSDLSADQLTGPLNLTTSDRDLVLKAISGPAVVTNRNGSVQVSPTTPLAPLRVANANGTVTVTLPLGAPFRLQAQAHDGTIKNAFPLPVREAGDVSSVAGSIGMNGPLISLETSDDDIVLQRASAIISSSPRLSLYRDESKQQEVIPRHGTHPKTAGND